MFYHIIMKNFKSNLKNYILFFVSNILAIAELFAFWGLNDVVKKAVKDGVTAATLTFSGKRKENAWKELSEYQKECGVKNDSDTRMESYLYGTEEYLIGQKMRVLFSLSSKLFLMMALFISAFFVNGIKILSELSGYERRYEFLRCMGMKQKQRRKTIRFETQMLSDIALFATVMMGIVYVLSYEWRCASKDAGSLDVTFWMYWILIVGIYLLADRLVQWLFAQYVIKRVEKGND